MMMRSADQSFTYVVSVAAVVAFGSFWRIRIFVGLLVGNVAIDISDSYRLPQALIAEIDI